MDNLTIQDKNTLKKITQTLLTEALTRLADTPTAPKKKVFLSCTDGTHRAITHLGIGNTYETALKQATDKILKQLRTPPTYIHLQVVTTEQPTTIKAYYELLANTRRAYLRWGIAFDEMFNTAFVEQEIHANNLIKWENSKTSYFLLDNINAYMKKGRGAKNTYDLSQQTNINGKLILFDTVSTFYGSNGEYHHLQGGHDHPLKGIREITYGEDKTQDQAFMKDLITKSADYLYSTLEADGRTVYGYFPIFNTQPLYYNVIRHTLAAFAFADVYLLTKDNKYKAAAISAFDYTLREFLIHHDEQTAFIIDRVNAHDIEIKLGALGVTILAGLKVMETLTEEEKRQKDYLPTLRKLGQGILYLQNPATGNYTHVLDYPAMNVKEEFRIVYYAGEAAFALAALYTIDPDPKWMASIDQAMPYFIANNYYNYYDHWLAYAVNEVSKHKINEDYLAFGLKNAFSQLDFIEKRDTAWHTFLEMLNASWLFIEKIRENKLDHLLEGYDTEKLKQVMDVRFKKQIPSVMYPEVAMFFKRPDLILWGAGIRHHTFRVRNDDVSHHLMGVCNYYRFRFENGEA